MNQSINYKNKSIFFIFLSVIIIFLAVIVYYYQSNQLNLSADTNPTYSQICIQGKINGAQTTKCFSNDETDGTSIKQENQTLNLEVGENYRMEFTLGDFILNPTDSDGMLPVHQKCQYIMLGQWGWDFKNCGAMCTTSLVYWLFLGLDTNIFNGNFSNLSGETQSASASVDDTKTLVELHESEAITGIVLSGYASHKSAGDLSVYNPTLAAKFASCGPSNNENEIIKYGGQHEPGDKIIMSFTPDVPYKGHIAGYDVNGQKSSGDVYGAGIIIPVNITNTASNDNNDNSTSDNSDTSDTSSAQKTVVPIIDNSKSVSQNNSNTNTANSDTSSASETSSDTTSDQSDSTSSTSVQDIQSLVSTGASIWFNLLIAAMLIIGIGYFIFREDIFKH